MANSNHLWAIVDLDGTVSDCSARVPLANAARAEPDPVKRAALWSRFHEGCGADPPYLGEVQLCHAWIRDGGRIIWLTGRSAEVRVPTVAWLNAQHLPTGFLIMRSIGNYTSSLDYKRKMYGVILSMMEPEESIAWVMEDDERLVEQWRDLGLTCLQPRHSAY